MQTTMSVKDIETAIEQLSTPELAELAAWFAEYHARAWDQQLEQDLDAGKLDALLLEVETEYNRGAAKPL